jgi:hypothetical protein
MQVIFHMHTVLSPLPLLIYKLSDEWPRLFGLELELLQLLGTYKQAEPNT